MHAEPQTVISVWNPPPNPDDLVSGVSYFAAGTQRFDARTFGAVGYVNFWVVAVPSIFWTVDIGTPNNEPFHLGLYDNADTTRDETPYLFLNSSGSAPGGTGWFNILDFAYNPDGSLVSPPMEN